MKPPTPTYLKLLEQLGKTAYRAHYQIRSIDRLVFVKYLLPNSARDDFQVARFFRQARLMASLNHANISKLHEVSEFESWLYLIMEYVPGVTLGESLSGRIEHDRVAGLDAQMRDVLNYVHSLGIYPKHLSPENALVTEDDRVKVVAAAWEDFGVLPPDGPIRRTIV